MNKPKYIRAALHRSVAALRDLEKTRPLQLADLRAQAKHCGYSVRHIRRCLGEPSSRPDTPTVRTEFQVCRSCNAGMGMLRGDPALLRAGADYLDSWDSRIAAALTADS